MACLLVVGGCGRHPVGSRQGGRSADGCLGRVVHRGPRLDTMLLADLERVCARYSGLTKTACDSLAHT
jgi:hypothetical protein